MAKQDILPNLWVAADRFFMHRVYPPSGADAIDPRSYEDHLANTSLWLNHELLSEFHLDDFPVLDEDHRRELAGWVRQFREIADSIGQGQSVSHSDSVRAFIALQYILRILRPHFPLRSETLQINQILSEVSYPESVQFLEFEIGVDSTGDPAVWIWVVVDDEAAGRKTFSRESSDIDQRIHEALSRAGIERWPYIRYRTLSEHLDLSRRAV